MLLTTKLNIPQVREEIVPRPQLIAQIQRGLRGKLTLIVAPAGYGKTTLLCTCIAQSTLPVAWISLDERDNEGTRFWSYILAAVDTFRPGTAHTFLPLLPSSQSESEEAFLTAFINILASISEHVALVLDDYHLISSKTIHAAITFLIERLPPNIHVVLSCRTEPPLPLARLYAQGGVLRLHLTDLRFSGDEAEIFLTRLMGLKLSIAQVEQLQTRTEGWIAGLQLAALSMQHDANIASFIETFSGNDHYIFNFFAEEVFRGLPEQVQQFLLQTAILDHLNGSLCDAVIGQTGSVEILIELERRNLFIIPVDRQQYWYRYHHLFRDYLRRRLSSSQPDLVVSLQRRAALWYARIGQSQEAIPYALAAADFPLTAQLLEEITITTFVYGGAETMLAWLDALPNDVTLTRPRLGLARTFSLLALSQFAAALPYVQKAEIALQNSSDIDASMRQTLKGYIEAVYATIMVNLGEAAKAIEHSHQALRLLTREDELSRYWIAQVTLNLADAYWTENDLVKARTKYVEAVTLNRAVGNLATTITAISALGHLLSYQGLLYEAEQIFRQAIAFGEEDGVQLPWPSTGKAYIYLGEVLYKLNDLMGAMQHLNYGIRLCEQWRHVYHVAEGMRILAEVYVAQGKLFEGLRTLERANGVIEEAIFRAPETVSLPRFHDLSHQIATAQSEVLTKYRDLEATMSEIYHYGQPLENSLSERELEVLSLLAKRLSSVEIARELIVSVSTIRTHIKHIYGKLDAHTRNEAIERARLLKLL